MQEKIWSQWPAVELSIVFFSALSVSFEIKDFLELIYSRDLCKERTRVKLLLFT